MSLERALALVGASPGQGYPNPTVGAVVVAADGEVAGEGVSEPAGGRHAEVVALDAAGDASRGATLHVTMEPCAHHGRTPPCVDRIVAAGVSRVVAGCADPAPEAGGRGGAAARGGDRRGAARPAGGAAPERGLAHVGRARPAARDSQARRVARRARRRPRPALGDRRGVATPGARAARLGRRRRRRHGDSHGGRSEARRARRARAPPAATARVRPGSAARGVELELRSGTLPDELAALASEGVQSLLLEGGPRIATSFLAAGLVDRLLLFVAPVLAGDGPAMLEALPEPLDLGPPGLERLGDDILLDWRLQEV